MTGRGDLDARRFCRHISFKVMLRTKPIYVIRHHWLVLRFGNNIPVYTKLTSATDFVPSLYRCYQICLILGTTVSIQSVYADKHVQMLPELPCFGHNGAIHQKVIGQPSQLHCRSITCHLITMSNQVYCYTSSLSSTKRSFCRRGWLKSEHLPGF